MPKNSLPVNNLLNETPPASPATTTSPVRSHKRRVLARKYRPTALKDIIGQDVLVRALTKGLLESRIPQAILLHGIRGTGKTSTARILARTVNCSSMTKDSATPMACGQCRSCKAFDEDRHPDILEMDAASHTGVDDIREIIDASQYKAITGRYKVFIIDEVHMLSKSAFNALLKTLEEPPSHVLFVFATTEIHKIPETILSRCARFDLKRVDASQLISHFQHIAEVEGYTIDSDALAMIARTADGSVRDGLTMLDQAMNLTDAAGATSISKETVQAMVGAVDRERTYNVLAHILGKRPEEAVQSVRGLVNDGADPIAVMQDLMECVYRVACFKVIPRLATDITIPEFERKLASAAATGVEDTHVLSLWKKMLKGFEDVKKAPYSEQALEMVVLRLCFAATVPSLEAFMKQVETGRAQGVEPLINPQGNQDKVIGDNVRQATGVQGFDGVRTDEPPAYSSAQPPICEPPLAPDDLGAHMMAEPYPSIPDALLPASEPLSSTSLTSETSPASEPAPLTSETSPAMEPAPLTPETSPASPPSPAACESLPDLLRALEEAREVLLLSYIKSDMAFVSFEPGNITVQLKNAQAEKIFPTLKRFLNQLTGKKWMINIDQSNLPASSILEQRDAARAKKEQEILQGPFIREVKKEFPGAKVSLFHDD
jgi:DNA polymerase-3 subunit gamma/tau